MLKCFHPCFRLGLHLARQRPRTARPGDARTGIGEETASAVRSYRTHLLKKTAEAEHRAMIRWGPEAAGTARRMVTVWLDEILIKSPWPGREGWLSKPLQSEWSEGRSGGLWFFRELEGLNPARRDDRELAALALRCISLGLTGVHGREPGRLNEVRREIQERFGFRDDAPIFPPPPPESRRKKFIGPRGRRLLAAMVIMPLLLWLLGGFSLSRILSEIELETGTGPPPARPDDGAAAPGVHGRLKSDGTRGEKL